MNGLLPSHAKYRKDIDGLRAIAVLSVVAFHAFPEIMRGGYIGVDIFFVISGYLITGILLTDTQNGNFSLIRFYNRRIRRIFPALIVVLLFCFALGWNFLAPNEFQRLGEHISSGTTFTSNLTLLRESGYFDASAESKPLLHLWSLAIEEQFYIVWPLIIFFALSYRVPFLVVVALIAIASFSVNIFLINSDNVSAFYSPFSRAWELLSGGFLAYISIYNTSISYRFKHLQSIFGISLIAISLAVLDTNSAFPGWWALPPISASILMISAGPEAIVNRYLLSNPIAVFIGLISYPLYLWHWPLLSFTRILNGQEPSPELRAGVVCLSLALAYLTYRIIEKNTRRSSQRYVTWGLAAFMLVCFAGARMIVVAKGVGGRQIASQLDFLATSNKFAQSRASGRSCIESNGQTPVPEEVCISNSKEPRVLFVGDSHAMALYSAISAKEFELDAMLIGGHACPVYGDVQSKPKKKRGFANNCSEITSHAVNAARNIASIKTVVISYSFGQADTRFRYFRDGQELSAQQAFIVGNKFFIDRLKELHKDVVFVIDVPSLRYNPEKCITRSSYFFNHTECRYSRQEYDQQRKDYFDLVNRVRADEPFLKIFDPTDIFCDNSYCAEKADGHYLYFDSHHISIFGSQKVLSALQGGNLLD